MRRIVQAFQQYSEEILEEFGVSNPQLWLLKTLQAENGISVTQLSQRMFLHISTVSITLKRLERGRYITRKRSKTDRRMVRVHLARKGEKITLSAPEPVQGRLLFGFQKLSLKEILNCHRALKQIVQLMEVTIPEDISPNMRKV